MTRERFFNVKTAQGDHGVLDLDTMRFAAVDTMASAVNLAFRLEMQLVPLEACGWVPLLPCEE
jgi:hypothetical protein